MLLRQRLKSCIYKEVFMKSILSLFFISLILVFSAGALAAPAAGVDPNLNPKVTDDSMQAGVGSPGFASCVQCIKMETQNILRGENTNPQVQGQAAGSEAAPSKTGAGSGRK